jgi:predicted N-acyltransferase
MDGAGSLSIEILGGLGAIDRADWDGLANPPGEAFDPFLSWDFLEALEASGCAAPGSGWTPLHLIARNRKGAALGAMPLYAKTHSYGEYVFDHTWADAYQRAGGRYYPKLQSAVPFTPAPGRRLLAKEAPVREGLALGAVALAQRMRASSVHLTFEPEQTSLELKPLGFLGREGLQYHWFNRGYSCFDDFLGALSSQKRKTLRRERQRAAEGVRIRRLAGTEIKPRDWDFFFRCYMDTGSRKWGSPYLNREFFALIGKRMSDRLVLFIAEANGRPVASALNFIGSEALYGRYWGRVADIPFLHFELCYYQAIDLAIEMKLARVEAGAQGDHKLARGYAPIATHSSHWIADSGLRHAIARYLEAETPAVAEEREALAEHTPFKKSD